ncbi:MAG: hypothetical protein U1E29_14185 [Coriobacteriia bacterium]|nr:hypothetical protein [Coriobacteriia bacterium]
MHRSSSAFRARTWVVASIAAILFAVPSIATAAPVPLDGVTLQIQLMPEAEPGTSVLIVGVDLPEGTPLPATVRLPLPEGAEVFWAGELTGLGPEDDILREFTIVEGIGGQAVEFTVEETLTVQYDALYGTMGINDGDISTTLRWLQTVPTGEVSIGVRIPPRSEQVRLDPAAPGPPISNSAGESLYTLRPVNLEPDSEFVVSVTYRRAGSSPAQQGSPLVPILLGLLAAAVLALMFALRMQARHN